LIVLIENLVNLCFILNQKLALVLLGLYVSPNDHEVAEEVGVLGQFHRGLLNRHQLVINAFVKELEVFGAAPVLVGFQMLGQLLCSRDH
jgi:hypothetical protein